MPVAYAEATLRAESFVDCIELYHGARRVAEHRRSYQRVATVLDLAHYLEAFARKPRAALRCAALAGADPVFGGVRDLAVRRPDGHRRFAEVLLLGRELGLGRLAEALRAAVAVHLPAADLCRYDALTAALQSAPRSLRRRSHSTPRAQDARPGGRLRGDHPRCRHGRPLPS